MKIIYAVALTVLLSSCSGHSSVKQKESASVRVIDLVSEPETKISDISEIASEIEYIPLETNENTLIRSIDKVIIHENNIYVQDDHSQVMCFNKAGKLMYKLNKVGRGPEEYVSLYDFDISSDNKILAVLALNKIIIFINTGTEFKFQKNINLKRPEPELLSLVPESNNILLSFTPMKGSEPSMNVLINLNGDTLCFKPNCYQYKGPDKFSDWSMLYEVLQYKFENSLCFKEEFSDTVFFFNKASEKYMPRLVFDSHGKGTKPRIRYDWDYARSYSGEIFWVYTIIEVPRYIIYSYEHVPERHRIVYDKITEKKYSIDMKNGLEENIIGGPDFDPVYCSAGKLISWIDAVTLKQYINSKAFADASARNPEKKEQLKKLADSLKETDNPVLVVVTPKK
jgi:hypothetical protein